MLALMVEETSDDVGIGPVLEASRRSVKLRMELGSFDDCRYPLVKGSHAGFRFIPAEDQGDCHGHGRQDSKHRTGRLPTCTNPMANKISGSINAGGSTRGRTSSRRSPVSVGTLRTFESAGQNERPPLPAYARWYQDPSAASVGLPEQRAQWFNDLESAVKEHRQMERQAQTIEELIQIRAFHGEKLRRHSLGTALGLRTRGGQVTDQPAIIAFVSRKVHDQWLIETQKLPSRLCGPGGIWCDVDVVEFSYNSGGTQAPLQPVHNELVEGLRGKYEQIGPGSQVASEEMFGTLGLIVRSLLHTKPLGFLTNHHVAVNFDHPGQHIYHPLPPSHGPGGYLGAVDRSSSFALDYHWYGVFSSRRPETFVRADGAFIPFHMGFDFRKVTAEIPGIGPIGTPYKVDLRNDIFTVVGRRVAKVGRTSGMTFGLIMGYAVQYQDDKGNSFVTDFLVLGEDGLPFDMEGDSGSAILLLPDGWPTPEKPKRRSAFPDLAGELEGGTVDGAVAGGLFQNGAESPKVGGGEGQAVGEEWGRGAWRGAGGEHRAPAGDELARPVGLIWGGTANKGRLKLRSSRHPENWTSGVDLARLLELLKLEAVTLEQDILEATYEPSPWDRSAALT